MKTALGYFFLSLGATFAGVVLAVLYFVVRGKIQLLDGQMDVPFQRVAMMVYGIFHILAIFPLFYYGIKWIKREVNEPVPPTGEGLRGK
jgi:hypothetical protein